MRTMGKIGWILALVLVLSGCKDATLPTEPSSLPVGSIDGQRYSNSYAGFGCTLDSDWEILGPEELQPLEPVEEGEIADQIEEIAFFTDMMAQNSRQLLSMSVGFSKEDPESREAKLAITEEEMLDITVQYQSQDMIEYFAQAGTKISKVEKVQVTFLEEPRWALKMTGVSQGVPCYILQVFNFKLGDYGVTLTVTSYLEDNTQRMLDLFTPAN